MNEKKFVHGNNINFCQGNSNNGVVCIGNNNSNTINIQKKKNKENNNKFKPYKNNKTSSSMSDRKVFFSHAFENKEEVKMLVELVEDMGVPHDKIICASIPDYGVPGGENIYDWLKTQIGNSNLRVVYLLSKEYYKSAVCLNEMGAAWITDAKETVFLMGNLDFKDIKGCLDGAKVAMHLDRDISELKPRLTEFKDTLLKEFKLPEINQSKWERKRDAFIERFHNRK